MKAIVRQRFGEPEELMVEAVPDPEPLTGHVVIEVKAIGLNHAEIYMRRGQWGDVPAISGIECAGLVKADPSGRLAEGTRVVAIMGGMGRTINGSYAELTRVPSMNVFPVDSDLAWEELAAVAESSSLGIWRSNRARRFWFAAQPPRSAKPLSTWLVIPAQL